MPHQLLQYIEDAAKQFAAGIRDACSWPKTLIVLYSSRKLQILYFKCLLLNGVVLIGSILFFNYIVLTLVHLLYNTIIVHLTRSITSGHTSTIPITESKHYVSWQHTSDTVLSVLYYVLWVYPVYCLTFILNGIWYQDIADIAYIICNTNNDTVVYGSKSTNKDTQSPIIKKQKKSFVQTIVEEIYRALMCILFLCFASLMYMIPFPLPLNSAGLVFSFVHVAWLYGYYSFEYKWISRGWSLEQRMRYLEENWAYFAGFGFPCTLMTFFFSTIVGGGIFALLFPMYIIMANSATGLINILSNRSTDINGIPQPLQPMRMPVFNLARRLTDMLIHRFSLLQRVNPIHHKQK